MDKTRKPAPARQDDNIDDLGRDPRTGKARDEQHPQQALEVGKQTDQTDTEGKPTK